MSVKVTVRNPATGEPWVRTFKGRIYELPEVAFDVPGVGHVVLPAGRVELFGRKVFSLSIERLPETLGTWERLGKFPPPIYRLPGKSHVIRPHAGYASWQVENINALYRFLGGNKRGARGGRGSFHVDAFLEKASILFYNPRVIVDPLTGEERPR